MSKRMTEHVLTTVTEDTTGPSNWGPKSTYACSCGRISRPIPTQSVKRAHARHRAEAIKREAIKREARGEPMSQAEDDFAALRAAADVIERVDLSMMMAKRVPDESVRWDAEGDADRGLRYVDLTRGNARVGLLMPDEARLLAALLLLSADEAEQARL